MAAPRLRAVVLAAGRGERLRPLTDRIPKPLLPVAGQPVAGHTLARLAAAGCEAAALNLHHLGDEVRAHFGARFAGMELTYSEEPELLGTLGALYPLREFLAPAELIVIVNGDSFCRWPLAGLLRRHHRASAAATLMLSRRADPAAFGGGVGVDREGLIRSFRPAAASGDEHGGRLVFAGAQVLAPEVLAGLGAGPADTVRDLYEPLLAAGGRVAAYPSGRRWHDLGTPRRYLEAGLDGGRGGWPERLWRRSRVAPAATVEAGARVRRAVVEATARVERGAEIERTLVLPGARVGAGAHLREAVVGPGVAVPAGTWVERRLITRAREGDVAAAGASWVGGLVYTPLDRETAAGGAGDGVSR